MNQSIHSLCFTWELTRYYLLTDHHRIETWMNATLTYHVSNLQQNKAQLECFFEPPATSTSLKFFIGRILPTVSSLFATSCFVDSILLSTVLTLHVRYTTRSHRGPVYLAAEPIIVYFFPELVIVKDVIRVQLKKSKFIRFYFIVKLHRLYLWARTYVEDIHLWIHNCVTLCALRARMYTHHHWQKLAKYKRFRIISK